MLGTLGKVSVEPTSLVEIAARVWRLLLELQPGHRSQLFTRRRNDKLLVRSRVPDEIDRNDDLDLVRIHFVDLDDETLGLPGLVEDDDISLAKFLVLLVVDL